MRFREFYEKGYRQKGSSLTTADEMRTVLRAYLDYRRFTGLDNDTVQSARAEALFATMEYHMGASEVAELSGEKEREQEHYHAFLRVLPMWIAEINGASVRGGNAATIAPEEATEKPGETSSNYSDAVLHFWRELVLSWKYRGG